MAISIVQKSSGMYFASSSGTMTFTNAPTNGNILVLAVLNRPASTADAIATPSGWSSLASAFSSATTGPHLSWFYKEANADASALAISATTGAIAGVWAEFSGVDTAAPIVGSTAGHTDVLVSDLPVSVASAGRTATDDYSIALGAWADSWTAPSTTISNGYSSQGKFNITAPSQISGIWGTKQLSDTLTTNSSTTVSTANNNRAAWGGVMLKTATVTPPAAAGGGRAAIFRVSGGVNVGF